MRCRGRSARFLRDLPKILQVFVALDLQCAGNKLHETETFDRYCPLATARDTWRLYGAHLPDFCFYVVVLIVPAHRVALCLPAHCHARFVACFWCFMTPSTQNTRFLGYLCMILLPLAAGLSLTGCATVDAPSKSHGGYSKEAQGKEAPAADQPAIAQYAWSIQKIAEGQAHKDPKMLLDALKILKNLPILPANADRLAHQQRQMERYTALETEIAAYLQESAQNHAYHKETLADLEQELSKVRNMQLPLPNKGDDDPKKTLVQDCHLVTEQQDLLYHKIEYHRDERYRLVFESVEQSKDLLFTADFKPQNSIDRLTFDRFIAHSFKAKNSDGVEIYVYAQPAQKQPHTSQICMTYGLE